MSASYVVYIDESGDEGFLFDKGSSNWFVLSAVITHKQSDLATVKLIDDVRTIFGRKDQEPLHFRKLKHEQRLPFLQQISLAQIKAVVVLIHKPSIIQVERFQQRNRLYFYAARLLIERVSWYCRDYHTSVHEGNGSAEIIFSNRGGMKYEEMREYLLKLQVQTDVSDIQIDWSVIRPEQLTAYSSERMGLQIADAVASGFFFGTQINQYGFTEDRYARMLKPIIYHQKGRYLGYGLKFWPREYEAHIKTESHLMWLQEAYNV